MTAHNRQTEKTRAAIKSAFAELVFKGRYDDIRMIDVARTANVGRSTLYMHYPDKDAILLENMAPMVEDLATATQGEDAYPKIEAVLHHIWSHRDRGRMVLFGTTGQKLENALAARVTENLKGHSGPLGLPFLANPIAAVTFTVIRTWLKGEASGAIPDIARRICLSSQALLTASR
ncbi:TetR/AcrR family transcriptional regulator [Ascidiaceihabitans sp.]|uniref:TetR/AcrR family transcriptional regulator n=1 Tax=Ascidiaceihabitans sp. TaxID=1872644 RepID=UPI003296836F